MKIKNYYFRNCARINRGSWIELSPITAKQRDLTNKIIIIIIKSDHGKKNEELDEVVGKEKN